MKRITPLFLALLPLCAEATPVPLDVMDVYSSVNVYYSLADGSDSGSLYEEVHGTHSASLNRNFDLGLLSGSQEGSISANPVLGTVQASGNSSTVLTSLSTGSGSGYEPNSFGSWGKHVVLGRFIVPDTGSAYTTIMVNVDFISSTNSGQALFRIEKSADWNPNQFLPSQYTPWNALTEDYLLQYSFTPGETVYFAFGIEPGVGGGGRYINGLTDADAVNVSYSVYTPAPVPEPSSVFMMLVGLMLVTGVAFLRKERSGRLN